MSLRELVGKEIERRGISQRQAAREIGCSHTTLVALIKRNRPLEVNTAYLICQWLGVPLTLAVDEVTDVDKTMSVVMTLLKAAPELEQIFTVTAKEIEDGTLSNADFKDILEYTAFKIQQRREHLQHGIQSGDPQPDRQTH